MLQINEWHTTYYKYVTSSPSTDFVSSWQTSTEMSLREKNEKMIFLKHLVLRLFYLVNQFDFVFVKCLFLIKADVLKSSGGVVKRRLWKTSLFLTKLFFLSFYLFTLVASFLFYSLGERWQTLRDKNMQNNYTGLGKPSMID